MLRDVRKLVREGALAQVLEGDVSTAGKRLLVGAAADPAPECARCANPTTHSSAARGLDQAYEVA